MEATSLPFSGRDLGGSCCQGPLCWLYTPGLPAHLRPIIADNPKPLASGSSPFPTELTFFWGWADPSWWLVALQCQSELFFFHPPLCHFQLDPFLEHLTDTAPGQPPPLHGRRQQHSSQGCLPITFSVNTLIQTPPPHHSPSLKC